MSNKFDRKRNFRAFGEPQGQFAESFRLWEIRGRGWQICDYETELEPVFSRLVTPRRAAQPTDDGRIPSLFGRLFSSKSNTKLLLNSDNFPPESSENYRPLARPPEKTVSFRIHLPNELKILLEQTEQLFLNLASSAPFIGFEIISTAREILLQIVCPETQKSAVFSLLKNHLPDVDFRVSEDALCQNILLNRTNESVIIDFGLRREWFIPLPPGKGFATDTLLPLIAAMEELAEGETVCLQVLFCRARGNWQQAVREAVFDRTGKPVFTNLNNYLTGIKEKLSTPLFAAVVRLAVQSDSKEKSFRMARQTSTFFRQFSFPGGNELIPLQNEGLADDKHLQSFLDRTTYRSGMLLSPSECSFFHFPSDAVKSEKLRREENRTKAAPLIATRGGFVLGENHHHGKTKAVTLSEENRTRHLLTLGATGSGKTNALLYFALQDIRQGRGGTAVFDVHGDLIDEIVANIPSERSRDVVLFDPSDSEFPIGFNPLAAHSETEKTLLTSDLIAIFRRFSTSWGDVMDSVLANAILAFVESSRGGNLFDLKRFLMENNFRDEFLSTVNDEAVKYFWLNEFPLIKGKPQSSILLRLDTFLRQKCVRNIVCQEKTLNFRQIMDEGKIFLAKLSLGTIGEQNSYLLGTLLLSKLQQTALSRQETQNRPFFSIYADEFHHLICPTISTLLSGIRKFRVGLALFLQQFRQIQEKDSEVAASVLANCATRLCFRLGDEDAHRFQNGFSFFKAESLQNLPIGEAIARIERAEYDFNLKIPLVPKVPKEIAERRRRGVLSSSREQFATSRIQVEDQLFRPTATVGESSSMVEAVRVQTVQTPIETRQIQPNSSGRGGKNHRQIQAAVKRMAESYGFQVEIEKEVSGGNVDISLEKENLKIACEVSVTTTDYEANNVRKSLASGYDLVCVISSQKKKIPLLKSKIYSEISLSQKEQVKVLCLPDFLTFLRSTVLPKDSADKKKEPKGQRLSFAEACEFFGVGASTLYRWINQGRIPFYRPGREYQFDREELALIGRHELSGKRKATVKLEPLKIEKAAPKSKKEQDKRYRKMLKLD